MTSLERSERFKQALWVIGKVCSSFSMEIASMEIKYFNILQGLRILLPFSKVN